jgi:NAD-reducing hydrogenase large subunit
MGKKIVIDPITRVEGHGKVTLHLDDSGNIEEARFHIVEFRGFERFIQGRPYWEVPVVVQRLCGICPVSHHLAAAKAMDEVVGVTTLPPAAEKMRRLMHYGQMFQSHALHFFYLASPDLLLGYEAPLERRNIVGVALQYPDLAKKGILMRKFGQEIILATAGKKIHGISAVPGGIHKNLSLAERDRFLQGILTPEEQEIVAKGEGQGSGSNKPIHIQTMIEWSLEILDFFKKYHKEHQSLVDEFAHFPSNFLSLVRKDGALDFYHGVLRAIDEKGKKILNDVDYHEYLQHLQESIKPWSFMKFPFLKSLGKEKGWYRVGPLARLNTCDFIPTPLAQQELETFRRYTQGTPNGMTLHSHYARLIELLHSAEEMEKLLHDPDLQDPNRMAKGERQEEGIGVIEAPRGTLFHHYKVAPDDSVTFCNLIVSTTHNNTAFNQAVRCVAEEKIKGKTEITEGMMNAIEVAIRAYDPCLSCATHALGQMPLQLELFDSKGTLLHQAFRN